MMNKMSRQDAADLLDNLIGMVDDSQKNDYDTALKMGIEALKAYTQSVLTVYWIPCIERLPQKERKTYWVCTDIGSQHECRWTNNRYGLCESDTWGWSVFDIPQFTEVVAWMPLPESYKGGQKAERGYEYDKSDNDRKRERP